MAERRRESRIRVTWPICVAGISGVNKGQMVNASLSGLLFDSDVELNVNDLVIAKVTLSTDTVIDCAAQIVRVDTLPDRKQYAAEIRYISAANRQKLSFSLMLAQAA